jgi:hypothetical protein
VLAIAENFMTGLKVVFDRERSVLGWEKFDCKIIAHLSPMISLLMSRRILVERARRHLN